MPSDPRRDVQAQIDDLCDRFEIAWRANGPSPLLPYLQEVPIEIRGAALEELLLLKWDIQQQAGNTDELSESTEALPEYAAAVQAAWRRHQARKERPSQPPPNADRLVHSPGNQWQAERTDEQPTRRNDESDVQLASSQSPTTVGRYQIISPLGQGSFGSVFRAFDPQLNRNVALKIPRPNLLQDEHSRQRFFEEARNAAQLNHSGIVTVYDVGISEQGLTYVVMELIDGASLADRKTEQPFSTTELINLFIQLSEAAHHAHIAGIVHRDLKPANVLIDEKHQPRIVDFGLAIHEDAQRQRAGEQAGTLHYMSPEQVRGESHRLDGRTDIWAIGVMLYELLLFRRPFQGSNAKELMDEILHREPKPPRQVDDALAPELERICLRCLEKDVRQRYATAKDMVADLQQLLDNDGTRTSSTSLRYLDAPGGGERLRLEKLPTNSNLPVTSTPLFGRVEDARNIQELLSGDTSLLTLLGPPGIGKSRLAEEVGRQLTDHFPGGSWWVDLSSAETADDVSLTVLRALDTPVQQEGAATEQCGDVLQLRKPLLLILDNLEHLVDVSAETIGSWRQRCPNVKFLTTSRLPLGLAGEQQCDVQPLAIPENQPTLRKLREIASVRLFVSKAQQQDPQFALTKDNAAEVASICVQLEGIPLAIELAAARVKLLSPAQLSRRLADRFDVLRSDASNTSQRQHRHRTLWEAIDWSHQLLSEAEQHTFWQLCAFTGNFSLETAEAVVEFAGFTPEPAALDVIDGLLRKCFLRSWTTEDGIRFGMYATLREFGLSRREDGGDDPAWEALMRRFTAQITHETEQWSQQIPTPTGPLALNRLERDFPNLFAAQDWASVAGESELAVRATLASVEAMSLRCPALQRIERLQQAMRHCSPISARLLVAFSEAQAADGKLEAATDLINQALKIEDVEPETQAAAWRQQGELHRAQGHLSESLESYQRSQDIAREHGESRNLAITLLSTGFVLWQQGEASKAERCYAEADEIARRIGDQITLSRIARNQGHLLVQRGKHKEAKAAFSTAGKLAKRLGDKRTQHLALTGQGVVCCEEGNYQQALRRFRKAADISREIGQRRGIAVNQANCGLAYLDSGDFERALESFTSAARLNQEINNVAGIAVTTGSRGAALAALGRNEEALECLCQAEDMHREHNNLLQLAITLGEKGCVLGQLQRYEDARIALLDSLQKLNEADAARLPEHCIYQVAAAKTCQELGNDAEAAEHIVAARQLAAELALASHPRLRVLQAVEQLAQFS